VVSSGASSTATKGLVVVVVETDDTPKAGSVDTSLLFTRSSWGYTYVVGLRVKSVWLVALGTVSSSPPAVGGEGVEVSKALKSNGRVKKPVVLTLDGLVSSIPTEPEDLGVTPNTMDDTVTGGKTSVTSSGDVSLKVKSLPKVGV